MALREYERRILAEIEYHLSEDDPELAGRLELFGMDAPSLDTEERPSSWRPWAVCAAIAAVVVGLLVALVAMTPGEQESSAPPATVDADVVAPEAGATAP